MIRQLKSFALVGIVLSTPVVLSAQDTDQTPSPAVVQAVEATFPQELRYTEKPSPGEESSPDYHSTCAAVFSRGADNEPTLVAAAYNGSLVELAMLAYTSGVAQIISTVPDEQFGLEGGACALGIINLADPAHPDSSLAKTVSVSFHDGPGWFFTWDGQKLQNITALRVEKGEAEDRPESDMLEEHVVDIDHAGAMQIVGSNGDFEKFQLDDGIMSSGTDTLFRYNGKVYLPAKTLIAIQEFKPNLPKTPDQLADYNSGEAAPWVMGIDMHQTPAPIYQLAIVNGDRDGSNRVSSAEVEVNGVALIHSSEINQNVEMLTRATQLRKVNDIRVTVDGPPKSHLYVTIE
jgi:hypothetical protein